MKNLILAIAVALFGYSASAQNTSKLVSDYMSVKNALVAGDSKAASQAITALQGSIKAEPDFDQKSALVKAADKMAKENNIEKQRAAFNDLSTSMWKVVKKADKVAQPVYYDYCPMKKAYWLSTEKEIKNPYYGSAMLTCGKVTETKN